MTANDDAPEALGPVAQSALRDVTTADPTDVERLGRGNRKRTRLVRFDDRDPVVVQTTGEPVPLRTESVVLDRVRKHTTVPVPEVLATHATDDTAVLVTEYVPGADLHTRFTDLTTGAQRALASTFGRYLGAVHAAFQFDRYGSLRVADGALTAETDDWASWFAEYAQTAIERLPPAFDSIRDDLHAIVAIDSLDPSVPPRLFPWDFRPGNAVVSDGAVAAILDWEMPIAAPPGLSAAKAAYLVADWYVEDGTSLRRAFVSGYGTVREYPAVSPAYRVAAIADSAVDSRGVVTNPGFPELDREAAIRFHRKALTDSL